jgi:hypothetical protein
MEMQKLIDHFKTPLLFTSFGTRDANMKPLYGRAWYARINDEGTELTMHVPEYIASFHLDNLRNNGRIAFTAVEFPEHNAYQVKGAYLGHEVCTEKDYEDIAARMELAGQFFDNFFGPDTGKRMRNVPVRPSLAIRMKVEDVFLQTPGPNAGKNIKSL